MTGQQLKRQCRVAVIGAGASGLVAARELRREGHEVVVFEQQAQLGGTWVYTDKVDSDLSGLDASRLRVHSSMYRGLTTNLPRLMMGFSDFPFTAATMAGSSIDARQFPCSEEVLHYLQAFAEHYHLEQLVRFNCQVLRAAPKQPQQCNDEHAAAADGDCAADGGLGAAAPAAAAAAAAGVPWQRWIVEWQVLPAACGQDAASEHVAAVAAAGVGHGSAGSTHREEFDALLVCNGHYSEPHMPQLPGHASFPGLVMHSHNYRSAQRFRGQSVAVVGASFSGLDIARLLAAEAQQVYLCAREWKTQRDLERGVAGLKGCANIECRGMITQLTAAGGVEFAVGEPLQQLDVVICCTGYNYHFPFLDLQALGLSSMQQHVAPLYQHMWPPSHAPGLAFLGLAWRVVPFPLFELQAKLCARLLSGRASLPPAAEMARWAAQHAQQLADDALPPSYSHYLDHKQLSYHWWLAGACGSDVSLLRGWPSVVLHAYWLWRWLMVAGLAVTKGKRSSSTPAALAMASAEQSGSSSK